MKNKFKVILATFLGICTLSFAFTGCAQPGTERQEQGQNEISPERNVPGENIGTRPDAQRPEGGNLLDDDRQTPGVGVTPQPGERNMTGLDNQAPEQQTGFDKQRADKIVQQLDDVEGVREINAVVNGNTAIVVYSPNEAEKPSDETDNMIAEKVKDIDDTITKVEVSHSPDAMTQTEDLRNNIDRRRPAEELDDMFERLMRTINPRR
ncbi:YhcN/YlaJ family sporulation lipoprotein [Herbivorax sp. ANBcel31]|uniref:YhcN/YlaJ family sporulation lipoprotein n=1 Tax=Herbivorax sp. ANBcel31 TaxID=3069754 RepID=UPI0027B1F9C4|nr:YhcN/YlaJ family sporulation lipoprotein [Herbivorax sp. ANBcel31]MDQ2086837.1 YhcN/YlaJ family sporulation lipoprotein [Herbivorax sp. ANBcel31]